MTRASLATLTLLLIPVTGSRAQLQPEASRRTSVRFESARTANVLPEAAGDDRSSLVEQGGGSDAKKSPFLGVLYSLMLPGMGELYADRFERGRIPLIAEGVMWLGILGFDSYGGWIQNDARTYAAQHAGIVNSGKDDQFYSNIGNYISLEEYNAAKLVERNLAALYPEDVTRGYQWKWDTDANRSEYRDLRIRSDEMYNAVTFVVLGMIANRLWSAIQTALFIRDHNKTVMEAPKSNLLLQPDHFPGNRGFSGWRLTFSQVF